MRHILESQYSFYILSAYVLTIVCLILFCAYSLHRHQRIRRQLLKTVKQWYEPSS